MQRTDSADVDEPCQRGVTGSSVVSSTLGHRYHRDITSHHRNDAASQRLYTELMKIKHEEFSPQSGQSGHCGHIGILMPCVEAVA